MDDEPNKIFICGNKSAGKSTLWFQLTFNQDITLHQKIKLLEFYKPQIYYHLLHLTQGIKINPFKELYNYDPQSLYEKILDLDDNLEYLSFIDDLTLYFKEKKNLRSKKELLEWNFEYFQKECNLERFSSRDYIPTEDDVLYSLKNNMPITQTIFRSENNGFNIIDLGNEKNEIKKWKKSISNIDIMVYVLSLNPSSEFRKKQLKEFEEIINCEWFEKSSLIIILNKAELLTENKEEIVNDYVNDFIVAYQKIRTLYYIIGSCLSKDIIEKVISYFGILGIDITIKRENDQDYQKRKEYRKSIEQKRRSLEMNLPRKSLELLKSLSSTSNRRRSLESEPKFLTKIKIGEELIPTINSLHVRTLKETSSIFDLSVFDSAKKLVKGIKSRKDLNVEFTQK